MDHISKKNFAAAAISFKYGDGEDLVVIAQKHRCL